MNGPGEGQGLCSLVEVLPGVSTAFSPDHDPPATIHAAVPPIFDGVVASTTKAAGNFRPPFPHLTHQSFDDGTFIRRNGIVVQRRFQILVETFPALLGRPRSDQVGYPHPIMSTLGMHKLKQV